MPSCKLDDPVIPAEASGREAEWRTALAALPIGRATYRQIRIHPQGEAREQKNSTETTMNRLPAVGRMALGRS
jgi:hypothetical protein